MHLHKLELRLMLTAYTDIVGVRGGFVHKIKNIEILLKC